MSLPSRRPLLLILLCWALVCPANGPADTPSNDYPQVQSSRLGKIAAAGLAELSGLAASRRNDQVLWAINDGGNPPLLYALGTNGAHLGSVRITGARNRDWEDIASFTLDGRSYLLIADTGDNHAQRKLSALYIVEEPPLTGRRLDAGARANITAQIRFTYEDGPRDCEAVAVDVARRKIVLLAKRTFPPVLYELPLVLTPGQSPAVARRRGTVADAMMPTAMDISRRTDTAAVLTYNRVYLFAGQSAQLWSQIFSRPPKVLEFPALWQQEALCFSRNGRYLHISSEGRHAPLLRIDLTRVFP